MNDLRDFGVVFKNYYSEINMNDITIEDKEREEFKKLFEEQGIENVDGKKFQETILLKKIIDLRIENLKKTKESFSKLKLNLLLGDKDITELNFLFDNTIDSLSKVDVMNLSKDEVYKKFTDLQEKLDSKMLATSINYVTKLVEEVNKSNDYQTFESVKQSIEQANLPKEAVDVFNSLTSNFGKPQVQNPAKLQVQEENKKENTVNETVENVIEVDGVENTEQQAIGNNEGSLENNNNNQPMQTLDQRINSIENNSSVNYGARVTEQINEFNVDIENDRIQKLQALREKNGKLSIAEAIELRTLVEKREIRKEKEINNSLANKAGDLLLGRTNKKLERALEKQDILSQKARVTKSFISRRRLKKLNQKIAKLRNKKATLTSFEIRSAMFSRELSEKLLTIHAVKNNTVKGFKSVKDKVMEKIRSNSNMNIILNDAPTIIDVPLYNFESVHSRTM